LVAIGGEEGDDRRGRRVSQSGRGSRRARVGATRVAGPGEQAREGEHGRAGRSRCWAELREKRSGPR
jgi:hypothetical protein